MGCRGGAGARAAPARVAGPWAARPRTWLRVGADAVAAPARPGRWPGAALPMPRPLSVPACGRAAMPCFPLPPWAALRQAWVAVSAGARVAVARARASPRGPAPGAGARPVRLGGSPRARVPVAARWRGAAGAGDRLFRRRDRPAMSAWAHASRFLRQRPRGKDAAQIVLPARDWQGEDLGLGPVIAHRDQVDLVQQRCRAAA